ncbi:MAG TPA: hypothetical protein VJC15_03995 [Candidatus Paceibacterota bacterium]
MKLNFKHSLGYLLQFPCTRNSGCWRRVQRHEEDVDGDGNPDLMFHFRQDETTLTCDSTEATLTGKTSSEDLFIGTDSIDTKGK